MQIIFSRPKTPEIQKRKFFTSLDENIKMCTHVLWSGKSSSDKLCSSNAVFYGEKAIDRSPCGTGTSARLAQKYFKGELTLGQKFIHKSIIDKQQSIRYSTRKEDFIIGQNFHTDKSDPQIGSHPDLIKHVYLSMFAANNNINTINIKIPYYSIGWGNFMNYFLKMQLLLQKHWILL